MDYPIWDVAIGGGDEFDVMSLGGPEDGAAAGVELAIVRVGAENNDAELAVVRSIGCGRRGGTEGHEEDQDEGQKDSLGTHDSSPFR